MEGLYRQRAESVNTKREEGAIFDSLFIDNSKKPATVGMKL